MDVKKTIITIAIILVLLAASFIGGYTWNNRTNSEEFVEYRNTITKLEEQVTRQRAKNRTITDLNKSISERLDRSLKRSREAERIVGSISEGISGDISDLDSIIKSIRRIRKALSAYAEKKGDI